MRNLLTCFGSTAFFCGKGCEKHFYGYPPRSHDCNPCESWFSQWQDDAAKLMKKKKNKSIFNWKCALEEAQKKNEDGTMAKAD